MSAAALRAYQRRKAQAVGLAEFQLYLAEQHRTTLVRQFTAAIAAGLEPSVTARAAWVAQDREDEFWDLFGAGMMSQALLPQD